MNWKDLLSVHLSGFDAAPLDGRQMSCKGTTTCYRATLELALVARNGRVPTIGVARR
jgi:hypothetical protein